MTLLSASVLRQAYVDRALLAALSSCLSLMDTVMTASLKMTPSHSRPVTLALSFLLFYELGLVLFANCLLSVSLLNLTPQRYTDRQKMIR